MGLGSGFYSLTEYRTVKVAVAVRAAQPQQQQHSWLAIYCYYSMKFTLNIPKNCHLIGFISLSITSSSHSPHPLSLTCFCFGFGFNSLEYKVIVFSHASALSPSPSCYCYISVIIIYSFDSIIGKMSVNNGKLYLFCRPPPFTVEIRI